MSPPSIRACRLVVFVLAFAPMVAIAATRDLWAPDEPRYAEVALECWTRGDFTNLELCGDPYPDKPPLTFVLTALVGALGGFGAVVLRIPTLLASLATACCIGFLARRRLSASVAGLAPALYLSTVLVLHLGGRLQIDPLLTLSVTAAITVLETAQRPLLVGALTGLGALTKGPVAWLFVGIWIALRSGSSVEGGVARGRLPGIGRIVMAVALAVVPVCTWAALASTREPSIAPALFFDQHLGRIFRAHSHPGPFFEPIAELLVYALPWTPLILVGWRDALRQPEGHLIRRAGWFALISLACFCVVADKRELYLLPIYPLLALFAAHAVEHDARRALTVSLGAIGLAALALGCSPLLRAALSRASDGVDLPLAWLPIVGGIACGGLWPALRAVRAARTQTAAYIAIGVFSTLLVGSALVVLPALDSLKSSRGAATVLDARPERPTVIPCVGVRPEAYRFFTRRPTVADQDALRIGEALLREGKDFLALVWERDLPRLPAAVRAGTVVLESFRVGSRDIVLLGQFREPPVGR